MKVKRIATFLTTVFATFAVVGCTAKDNQNQTYDGRVFDISVKQDKSLTATSKKVGTSYTLEISGSGEAIDYNNYKAVPWNPIVKKISEVTINDGIENIGDYYFYSMPLEYFVLPESVLYVGDHSFNDSSIIYTFGEQINNIENDVYYYSETKPTTQGNYFYMDNGVPVIWVLKQLSFLFIGNSFTYRGVNTGNKDNPEVPLYFGKIATNLGYDVKIDSVCEGSYTLTKFADKNDTRGADVEDKLTHNQYDYVILQEQSTTPINNYDTFLAAVTKLKNRINQTQTNCKTILYETWGTPYNTTIEATAEPAKYGNSVTAMEAKLRTAYTNAGTATNLPVNYVGKAFTEAYDGQHIDIYADDHRHQNGYGAYLSAAVHVRSIFRASVSNNTYYFDSADQTICNSLLRIADTVISF